MLVRRNDAQHRPTIKTKRAAKAVTARPSLSRDVIIPGTSRCVVCLELAPFLVDRGLELRPHGARGYTPMAYLKKVRLKAAREMLLRADPRATVTGIMFACNFSNQGHFASDYHLEFGELPSDTLRRSRKAAPPPVSGCAGVAS